MKRVLLLVLLSPLFALCWDLFMVGRLLVFVGEYLECFGDLGYTLLMARMGNMAVKGPTCPRCGSCRVMQVGLWSWTCQACGKQFRIKKWE